MKHELSGHGLSVRQFRQNNECDVLEELQPIDENRRYDFDFQQITHLPREIKVLPVRNHRIYIQHCKNDHFLPLQGDSIQLQCFYRTTSTRNVTVVR